MKKLKLILLIAISHPIVLFSSKSSNTEKGFSQLESPSSSPSLPRIRRGSLGPAAASADAPMGERSSSQTPTSSIKGTSLHKRASSSPSKEKSQFIVIKKSGSSGPSFLGSLILFRATAAASPKAQILGQDSSPFFANSLFFKNEGKGADETSRIPPLSLSPSSSSYESQKEVHSETERKQKVQKSTKSHQKQERSGYVSTQSSSPAPSRDRDNVSSKIGPSDPFSPSPAVTPTASPVNKTGLFDGQQNMTPLMLASPGDKEVIVPIQPHFDLFQSFHSCEPAYNEIDFIVVAAAIQPEFEMLKKIFSSNCNPVDAKLIGEGREMSLCYLINRLGPDNIAFFQLKNKTVVVALIGKNYIESASRSQQIIDCFRPGLKIFFLSGICGSLSPAFRPGDVIIPDCLLDTTTGYYCNVDEEGQYIPREEITHRLNGKHLGALCLIHEEPIPACKDLFFIAKELVLARNEPGKNPLICERLNEKIKSAYLTGQGMGEDPILLSMRSLENVDFSNGKDPKHRERSKSVEANEPSDNISPRIKPSVVDNVKQQIIYKYMMSSCSDKFRNLQNGQTLANIIIGGTGTSNTAFVDSTSIATVLRNLDGVFVDMEAAAMGTVCLNNHIPFMVVKSASDRAGNQSGQNEIRANRETSALNAAIVVRAIIDCIPKETRQVPSPCNRRR